MTNTKSTQNANSLYARWLKGTQTRFAIAKRDPGGFKGPYKSKSAAYSVETDGEGNVTREVTSFLMRLNANDSIYKVSRVAAIGENGKKAYTYAVAPVAEGSKWNQQLKADAEPTFTHTGPNSGAGMRALSYALMELFEGVKAPQKAPIAG